MKTTSQIVILSAMLLASCRVPEPREDMTAICRYWDAQKCNAVYGVSSNSKGGSEKTIRLTLEEVPLFDSINALGSIASVVALQFVSSTSKSAIDGFDQIAVRATKGTRFMDDAYLVSDLILADSMYRAVASFFELLGEHRVSDLHSLNDKTYLPDSIMNRMLGSFAILDSLGGAMHSPRILGFQLGNAEGNDLPVVLYRTQVSFGPKEYANVSFQVNQRNGKLSYLGVFDF